MLADFSDGMKLDGESKPILVDLSDEKKESWMFTLDGLILFWTLDAERWTAALFFSNTKLQKKQIISNFKQKEN